MTFASAGAVTTGGFFAGSYVGTAIFVGGVGIATGPIGWAVLGGLVFIVGVSVAAGYLQFKLCTWSSGQIIADPEGYKIACIDHHREQWDKVISQFDPDRKSAVFESRVALGNDILDHFPAEEVIRAVMDKLLESVKGSEQMRQTKIEGEDRKKWNSYLPSLYDVIRKLRHLAAHPFPISRMLLSNSVRLSGSLCAHSIYTAIVAMPQGEVNAIVKVIGKRDEADLAKLNLEINCLDTCRHPNIVEFYGLYEDADSVLYLVLERCEKDLTAVFPLLPLEQHAASIKRWAIDIATGLDYLHQKDFAHCHLTLDNIVLSNGRAKIIDFETATQVPSFGLEDV